MKTKIAAALVSTFLAQFLCLCLHAVVFAFSLYFLTGCNVPFYLDFLGACALGAKGQELNIRLAIVLWIVTLAGFAVPLLGGV